MAQLLSSRVATQDSATSGSPIGRLSGRLDPWLWLTVPALLFLGACFLLPLYQVLERSVTEPVAGAGNFVEAFASEQFRRVLLNTLRMALIVTLACALLAYPYAYLMVHASRRVALLMLIAVLLPFWSSVLVRTYSWTVILQDTGIINSLLLRAGIIDGPLPLVRSFTGATIGMVHVLVPYMLLPVHAAMRRVDPDLIKAAANLGASPLRAFRQVFLPLSMPGLYAGCLLVFVISLGFYITPALLGDPRQMMLSQLVTREIELQNWGLGSAMALVLLVVTLAILLASSRVVRVGDVIRRGAGAGISG
jgi:ABC-type spermidine/putrescine transport system permease subunit I